MNPNYDFERKGSVVAMIFWILMTLACYVCIYALLHNHFYDLWPIVGLMLLSGVFVFFSLLSLWTEKIEFRPEEFYHKRSGLLFKTREKHWNYADIYLKTIKTESRTKNGNSYIVTTFYQLFLYHVNQKGGVLLKKSSNPAIPESFERMYNAYIFARQNKNTPPVQPVQQQRQNTQVNASTQQQFKVPPVQERNQSHPPGDHGI